MTCDWHFVVAPPQQLLFKVVRFKRSRWLIFRMLAHLLLCFILCPHFSRTPNCLLWENGYWVLKVITESERYMVIAELKPLEGHYNLGQCFSNFSVDISLLGILLKWDFDAVGLRWDLSFSIFQEFSGDAEAAGTQTTLGVARVWCYGNKMPVFNKLLLACSKKGQIIT